MLDDETLRDGLQSPSVRCPTIDEKIRILHLIDKLGIDTANIGLPGAGPHVVQDVERLAREIADQRLASARTARRGPVIADIRRSSRSRSGSGCRSSAARSSGRARCGQYAEGWSSTSCSS